MKNRVGMRFAVDHDTALYLQRTSFLLGPDALRNVQLRRTLPEWSERRFSTFEEVRCQEIRGHPRELLDEEEWRRLHSLGAKLGLSEKQCQGVGQYYAWKLKLGPAGARRILAFGCSTGMECIAIKALFPEARQVLLDFNLRVASSWLAPLGVEAVHSGTLEDHAARDPASFDLIFSNHTLEHLANPERALSQLLALLKPGGVLVSAIPLEWFDGSFARDAVQRMEAERIIHPLDCSDLHLGHLWKTSPQDVAETLQRAGFCDANLYRRADYPTAWRNEEPMHRSATQRRERMGRMLNRVSFTPLRKLLKRLFPQHVPKAIAQSYFRLEARLWFSNLQLHHMTVQELAFRATKPE